jgi:hypothetical protein
MDEPLTISKDTPDQKSMDYNLLREEGIRYIQNIAGKIWTDYNVHDPGITILEVLCYALTDLGYRTSYDIKDLIASPPDAATSDETHDFFTAAEILPVAPVTSNDYRKLMIDVSVESTDPGCSPVGVKNAWIEIAAGSELDIFVDKPGSKLTYEPAKAGDQPLNLKILHNILLEFGVCDTFGDLNENTLVRDFTISNHAPDPELDGVVIRVTAEFPRWDDPDTDWETDVSTSYSVLGIDLSFQNLGGNFSINYQLNPANEVILGGTKVSPSGPVSIDGLAEITQDLNSFIFGPESSMIQFYKQKITKIREITDRVKARLHANRNLCEDFLEFNALRIEEILVCADIELAADADVDLAQAQIYHEIAKFLSPTVHFYSLDEMATRCYDDQRYDITSISTDSRSVTVEGRLDPLPEPESVITIDGSNNNNGVYTVELAAENKEDKNLTDLTLEETLPSDLLSGSEQIIIGDPEENPCSSVEKIFEGPLLNHGFIDNDELELADRRKVIHVSDLIQIIMDVNGVVAVKSIQIANAPQDNEDGAIPSKNVRWCLNLAFDQNYVPRLNTDRSRLTFYKDQLPFKANRTEVDELMKGLAAGERPQKPFQSGPFDLAPPVGEYKETEEYLSIQNEFPLVYGIGDEGVPTRAEQGQRSDLPTITDTRQLKGYLIHFDQLLANYLSQLAHVKELFSMNPQRDEFGDFVIGRTYYTQTLLDIVPDALPLYKDVPGHAAQLNAIAESKSEFRDRRNRFLDHLIARFAEQFTDYALLTNRISGVKAQDELIEDKLAFLNGYPEISSRRGTALNYRSDCYLWHKDNVSGLENRASLLTGIDERPAASLNFRPRFIFSGDAPDITFSVENDLSETLLQSSETYQTLDDAKVALETVIAAGVQKHSFTIVSENETEFSIQLLCDGELVAESEKKDFASGEPGGDADQAIDEILDLLRDEFFNNPESNRHNLACPLQNYFDTSINLAMELSPPAFTISYDLYQTPFLFSGADPVLSGEQTVNGPDREKAGVESVDPGSSTITVTGQITEDLVDGDTIHIQDSVDNDGTYTIASFSIDGDNTAILVDEPIPSDTGPLGTVLYNIITAEEMNALAESSTADLLWKVVANGARRGNYSFDPPFTPFTPPYRFHIRGFRGTLLGESVQSDFNNRIADEFQNLTEKSVTLVDLNSDSDAEPDNYSFVSASARGPYVDIETEDTPDPIPDLNWTLKISDSFVVTEIKQSERIFMVEADLTDRLSEGETVTVSGHPSSDGDYTILSLLLDGALTEIKVKEPIPSGDLPDDDPVYLGYTKSFEVVKTSGKTITVKGGGDEHAVSEMIDFITDTFFSHEGLHLIEHILLRPKTDELLFADAGEEALTGELSDNGKLTFTRQFDILEADKSTRTFVVNGDLTADLSAGMTITILDTPLTKGTFTVNSVTYSDPVSKIVVEDVLVSDITAGSSNGSITFTGEAPISSVDPTALRLTIPDTIADSIKPGSVLEISGSGGTQNDGRYTTAAALNSGSDTEITIDKAEKPVQDRLLSINLDDECECTLENPYTCMAHVILPYWPGRFSNTEFRTFFEKTLRREAPAHIYLNICWVSCRHMADFERAWKAWLIENAGHEIDAYTLSTTLNELIHSIEQLRNVYPKGTLHDCDEDENLENSIILNHSALGEI